MTARGTRFWTGDWWERWHERRHPERRARDRGLGVRRRADGRHDARAARRRRHPLRRPARRAGLQALAADVRWRQSVLVRPAEGQALVHRGPALRGGARDADAAHHRARRGQRHLPDELPGPRLDELRGAERAAPGPDHGRDERQPRRLVGGRLHRQPVRRLPRGDGPT